MCVVIGNSVLHQCTVIGDRAGNRLDFIVN